MLVIIHRFGAGIIFSDMRYKEIISEILSYDNGAITTLNKAHYENIHATVKSYRTVKKSDSGALMCKAQMTNLLESIKSKKCRLMEVGTRKK